MLTTVQVRNIMMRNGIWRDVYTNKTRANCGTERRVKCYMPSDANKATALIRELEQAAGKENVKVTDGDLNYHGTPGITVRCTLA